MNILAIGAHSDDIEILCGGTLALYAKQGHKIYMYNATDGDKGGLEKDSEQIRKERKSEAINSSKIIGAIYLEPNFHDTEIEINLKNRLLIIDLIRSCEPDVILTHSPQDYHIDHINISKLVFEASYLVGVPKLKTKNRALAKLPMLYYFDTVGGLNFNPTEYVDISEVMDVKIEMLKQHKSQLKFAKDYANTDFIDMTKICSRFRGYQCGVEYAEAFMQSVASTKASVTRVLP